MTVFRSRYFLDVHLSGLVQCNLRRFAIVVELILTHSHPWSSRTCRTYHDLSIAFDHVASTIKLAWFSYNPQQLSSLEIFTAHKKHFLQRNLETPAESTETLRKKHHPTIFIRFSLPHQQISVMLRWQCSDDQRPDDQRPWHREDPRGSRRACHLWVMWTRQASNLHPSIFLT